MTPTERRSRLATIADRCEQAALALRAGEPETAEALLWSVVLMARDVADSDATQGELWREDKAA